MNALLASAWSVGSHTVWNKILGYKTWSRLKSVEILSPLPLLRRFRIQCPKTSGLYFASHELVCAMKALSLLYIVNQHGRMLILERFPRWLLLSLFCKIVLGCRTLEAVLNLRALTNMGNKYLRNGWWDSGNQHQLDHTERQLPLGSRKILCLTRP